MAKFHINPETGNPGKCSAADGNCPYGSNAPHFSSAEDARSAYEAAQGGAFLSTAQKITLTKADAKKLTFPRERDIGEPYAYGLASEISNFYKELSTASYTAADKPATAAKIEEFLNKLYEKRNMPGDNGVAARKFYAQVISKLEPFGVKGKEEDEGDRLFKEAFPDGFSYTLSVTPKEYEESIRANSEKVELLSKPIEKLSDDEISSAGKAIYDNIPAFDKFWYNEEGVTEALSQYQKNLIGAEKRKEVLKVWDKLPAEAKSLYSKKELEEQIETLQGAETFSDYSRRGPAIPGNPRIKRFLSRTKAASENIIEADKEALAARKKYDAVVAKLDKLS